MFWLRCLVIPVMLLCSLSLMAQQRIAAPVPAPAILPAAISAPEVPKLEASPKLADFEGMEATTPLARRMLKVDKFVQREPHDDVPCSQRTEAYLGYTDKNLYVVFLAFDSEPQKIRARMLRRELIDDDDQGATELAGRARGTPRIANRLLRRVRDFAQVRGAGRIDKSTAQAALEMLEVDKHGFDEIDRRLLLTIIQKYNGGPVGLNTLAASLAEESDALEEIYEPFLIQIGFLDRTPRGRVATRLAYEHFNIRYGRQPDLF